MRRLNMACYSVVYAGEPWRHPLPPCSKEMMCHLERNERIVSWLQPVAGTVQDQIPALRVKDAFYSISLRMMKAIWRHVRLKKGFLNVERAPYGGFKLRIPVSLLAEKLRTQSRFNVSSRPRVLAHIYGRLIYCGPSGAQVMRSSAGSPESVKERKVSQSASSKIDSVVRQLFLPMLGMRTPDFTSFAPEDADDALLRQVAESRPEALRSEEEFLACMLGLYRKFQAH